MAENFLSKLNPFRSKQTEKVNLSEEDKYGDSRILSLNETGSTGTDLLAGILSEDYLQDLRGSDGADIYDKMRRSDPKVKMCLSAVMNPIKSASWEIEPANDSPEAEKLAEFCEYVFFNGMNKTWKKLLHEILTMVPFGFSLFERTHKVVFDHPQWGNHIRYKNFGFRSQRTIDYWIVDKDEQLSAVTQFAYGDEQCSNVDIPAKFLTLFSLDQEGNNFEGMSMLRPCYGPWVRKNTFLKLMAIGIEKFAVPTPIMRVPKGRENSEDYNRALEVLQAYTSHQSNYITLPQGWDIETVTTSFDASKVRESISGENLEMVNAFLANFLELGQSGSGSYALSFDLSDFFLGGIEHIADQIAEVFNQGPIREIIDLNFGPQDEYPEMKVSGISDKAGAEFAKILKDLSDSNYITPDEPTEEHLRRRLGLPKMSEVGRREGEPGGEPSPALLSEKKKTVELAEPKTPRGQIDKDSKEIRKVMEDWLKLMGQDLSSQVITKFKNATWSKRFEAIKGTKKTGLNDYKKDLLEALAKTSDKALKAAQKEVPAKGAKFAEAKFKDLPPDIQRRLKAKADLLADTQYFDLEKAVFFQYQSSIDSTEDPRIIEQDMNNNVDQYATGSSTAAAAGNATAFAVNDARLVYFEQPEVLDQIEAYRFENPAPVSPICQDLKGRVFDAKDPEADRYKPPLHHNCKSYLVPILKGRKTPKEIDPRGLKPSDPKLEKHITLGENKDLLGKKSHG